MADYNLKTDLFQMPEKLNVDELPMSGYILPQQDLVIAGHGLQKGEVHEISARRLDCYDAAYLKECALDRKLIYGQWTESLSACHKYPIYSDSLDWCMQCIRNTATASQRVWLAPRNWTDEPWHYDNGGGVPWDIPISDYNLSCEWQTRLSSETGVGAPGWLSCYRLFVTCEDESGHVPYTPGVTRNAPVLSAEPIRALYRDMNRFRYKRERRSDAIPDSIEYWNSYDNYNYIFRGEDNYGCFYGIKLWRVWDDSQGDPVYYTAMFQSANWPYNNYIKNVDSWVWDRQKSTDIFVEYNYHITVAGYIVPEDGTPWTYFTQNYYSHKFHGLRILKGSEGVRFSPNINEVKEAVVDHPSLGENYWDRYKLKNVLAELGGGPQSYIYVTVECYPYNIIAPVDLHTDLTKYFGEYQ